MSSEVLKCNTPMDLDSVIRTDEYGPIRRVRHHHKSSPEFLQRPQGMADEDLVEILQETLPQMIEEQMSRISSSPRPPGTKREASQELDDRESTRVRTEDQATESMLCEAGCNPASMSIDEALTAALLQKKLQKEIPPTNNDAELQQKVDVSKSLEWETLLGKNAVKIWTGR